MNYSELSDYEINNAVAVALGAKMVNAYSVKDVRESIQYDLNGTTLLVTRGFGDGPNRFDPCNSWADAGLIIRESGISVEAHAGQFPRAVMEAFLAMQEARYAEAA